MEKDKKFLLVVDVQKGFIKGKPYKELVKRINCLIQSEAYEKIIYTKFKNEKNSLYQTKLNWHGLETFEEQKICVEIKPNSIIFEKTSYCLSFEQIFQIESMLKKHHASCIDICGLQTDVCCYAISLQLFERNIFPNLLKNYCITSIGRNKNAINLFRKQFGCVDNKK